MPPRAVWKGVLRVGEVECPIALFTAVSTSERIGFHTINRATGHRVHRQFVDSDTGRVVAAADQVKGYDTGGGRFVVLEPAEIAATLPDNDKTMRVNSFLGCAEIDALYFDRPYYVTAADPAADATFALLRDGLKSRKVAALASAILFRRVRTVLIRAHEDGLIGNLLKFDDEVRSAAEAFDDLPDVRVDGEMIDLATHIIKTKMGRFDPKRFDDRYEAALADMVRAKIEGRPLKAPPAPVPVGGSDDLLAALRESARATKPKRAAAKAPRAAKGQRGSGKGRAAGTRLRNAS